MDPSDILIVVPARGGSKRLPGKNLMSVGGRTLIERTADFLTAEGLLEQALLTTDDATIAGAGRRAGLHVPFLRPAELATDTASSADVVRHALDWRVAASREPHLIALLQVTTPFRRRGLLTEAISILTHHADVSSVVAMRGLGLPARHVYERDEAGRMMPASAGESSAWIPTGALYLVRTQAFRSTGSLYAPPIESIATDAREAIDIDTAADLQLARCLA